MEDNEIDFGFIAISGICVLGLAGLFFYLNKKATVAAAIDSKINTSTNPLSNTRLVSSNIKTDETIKQITPEMINDFTIEAIVVNINLLNEAKLKYALGSRDRNAMEEVFERLKRKLLDYGYKFDELLKKAVKTDTNKVLNLSQIQSNKALINNMSISDEDKANTIAKKIQLILDTKSATESNLTENLNDILNLGYIYERDENKNGVARKIYDINRAGTNFIAKGFLAKNSRQIIEVDANLPKANQYPIKIYERLSNGSLVEYNPDSVISADTNTKVSDALEDKLRQINEQTKVIVDENKNNYNQSKTKKEVLNNADELLFYESLINLLDRFVKAQQEYLWEIVRDKFSVLNKLKFTIETKDYGRTAEIKREGRLVSYLPSRIYKK